MEEELQEADVLWPDTPPPPPSSRYHGLYRYQYLPPPSTPEQYELATSSFSCESFGDLPASSSSSGTASSGLALSGCFLSDVVLPSTSAGDEDDAASEEFLEADVLWPDDDDATGQSGVDDVRGELWWRLRCVYGVDAAGHHAQEPAAAGRHREACRPLASSPIDIPTNTTRLAAARRRWRCTTAGSIAGATYPPQHR